MLEDALEHFGCEGRDWSWIGVFVGFFGVFGCEADEQHCLAGDFKLVRAFACFLVYLFPLLLAFLLAFACFLVCLFPLAAHPDRAAILANVMNLNVVLQSTMHVLFRHAVLYKFFGLIRAPAARPLVPKKHACEG